MSTTAAGLNQQSEYNVSKIVDQYGNPIEQTMFDAPQTAQLIQLQREVASHPTRGLTPARLNNILEAAELGDLVAQHELFTDMEERDGHVFAELSKRRRSVTKLEWDIVAPKNASKEEENLTAYVKEMLTDMNDLEDMMFDALDGIAHGFSPIEYEWARLGSDWTIEKFHHRPQTWFQLDRDTRTQLRLRDNSIDGIELQPFGWMMHTHKATSGYIARGGLGRVLVWPYLFKHFSVGDLAEFLDIYGLPLRIGKYPNKATNAEKSALWQAVAGIGHNAAGIIPASMMIEFQEAAKGSEKPFEAMIHWCERTQSKAILGSTLTSEAGATGLGSGLADIHNEVRLDIRDSDCKQLAGTLTRDLIFPLLSINKGLADMRRCPRFVFDTLEAEDLKLYADSLPKLVGVGMKIPVHWAHEKLRIPQPQKDEAVLGAEASPALTDTPAALVALSAAHLKHSNTAPTLTDQDAIDGALVKLSETLYAQAELWLRPALLALLQTDSSEQALELLATDNPLVADEVLIESLTRAMFVAELIGADAALRELAD